jgi:hypothetical protein
LFILPDNAININGTISITADNAYELYFNDEFIGKDGYVSSPPITHEEDPQHVERWKTIETYNIKPKPGLNEIRIIAVNYRGWVDPYTNPAGIIYRADISYELLPIIEATLNVNPNTLNLESKGKWITAYIELPKGYSVADINRTTILLNGTIPVDPFWVNKTLESVIGDYDNDTIPDLMVKFDRASVSGYILSKNITYGNVTLTITGMVADMPFEGSCVIRVRMPGDTDCNGIVNIHDIVQIAKAYGSNIKSKSWNPAADENEDGKIDIFDLVTAARNYGKTYK